MLRADELTRIVDAFRRDSSHVQACALITGDGLVLAAAPPEAADHRTDASAGMFAIGRQVAIDMERGRLSQLILRAENGCVVMSKLKRDVLLIVQTEASAMLGIVLSDLEGLTAELEKLL